MEIDRLLSSHANFYRDVMAGITLDPSSAPYGVSQSPSAVAARRQAG
jgi:hypothetical protein